MSRHWYPDGQPEISSPTRLATNECKCDVPPLHGSMTPWCCIQPAQLSFRASAHHDELKGLLTFEAGEQRTYYNIRILGLERLTVHRCCLRLVAPRAPTGDWSCTCWVICWYRAVCQADMAQRSTCSVFPGSSASTSRFVLRSMNGLRTWCSRVMTKSCSSSFSCRCTSSVDPCINRQLRYPAKLLYLIQLSLHVLTQGLHSGETIRDQKNTVVIHVMMPLYGRT